MKVVAALAIMKDGKILMGKRKDNGKWTNPGGHVDEGEAPIHGAIREAKEEAGLDLTQDQLYHLDTKIVETPGGKISVHGYKVNLHEGQTTIKHDPDDEVYRWHWVSLKKPLNKEIFGNLHVPLEDNVLLSNLGINMEKKAFFVGFEKKANDEQILARAATYGEYLPGMRGHFKHTADSQLARMRAVQKANPKLKPSQIAKRHTANVDRWVKDHGRKETDAGWDKGSGGYKAYGIV